MFIDKADIYVKGGNGGNGCVAFRREIYVPDGGPAGGNGGRGGNVVLKTDSNMSTLADFKYKSKYVAENGQDGKGSNMNGKDGEDLIIKVPVGTVVKDSKTGLIICDLNKKDMEYVISRGGAGGYGNTKFKNSVRQAPSFAKPGKNGEERTINLELKLLADVGLVGFPNVGKSTFLSIATKANPKIANYHFTTLNPNLGVANLKNGKTFIIADIPGIIEGASDGIGLGIEFLKHIQRTKVLVHIVDISSLEGRDPYEDFITINNELAQYSEKLAHKPQIVVANKIDLLYDQSIFEEFAEKIKKHGFEVYKMSGATRQGVDDILNKCAELLEKLPDEELYDESELFDEEKLLVEHKDEIYIEKEDDVYYIYGERIEKILYSVNFSDLESLRHFQNVMEKTGVYDRLREMGIQDGDTVSIYDLEFKFYD